MIKSTYNAQNQTLMAHDHHTMQWAPGRQPPTEATLSHRRTPKERRRHARRKGKRVRHRTQETASDPAQENAEPHAQLPENQTTEPQTAKSAGSQ